MLTPKTCQGSVCPLVITLHGRGGRSEDALYGYGLDKTARKHGFILVSPEGQEHHWRDLDGDKLQERDLAFFGKLLDSVPSLSGDPKRVYVTGFSNGGGMTHVLGAHYSDRIAAIASGGASIGALDDDMVYHTIPDPKKPIPVLMFHGMMDDIAGYNMQTFTVGVQDAALWWARRDHTNLTPHHSETGNHEVLVDRYDGPNGLQVELLSYKRMEHSWPSSEDRITGMDFDEVWWQFLSRYHL